MIPKTEKALEREYKRCQKSFIIVDRETYKDYFEESLSDLDSAEKEENDKWALAKAYQALFLYCNGLLVKKLGFYSKDHSCVLISLLKNNIVSKNTLEKIKNMLDEKSKLYTETKLYGDLFLEISNIRIARNKYLYLPKTQRKLKESPNERINEIKEILKILSEIE